MWEDINFEELSNRTIFIDCALSDRSLPQVEDYDSVDLLDRFLELWENEGTQWKSTFMKLAKKHEGFTLAQWQVSRPLICASTLAGVFGSINEAIDTFRDYWSLQASKRPKDWYLIGCKNAITRITKTFHRADPESFKIDDPDLYHFKASVLRETVYQMKGVTLMIDRWSSVEFHKAMTRLGYTLEADTYLPGRNVWIPTHSDLGICFSAEAYTEEKIS
jgi:hypothetical protein